MSDVLFLSGRDMFLYTVPLIAALIVSLLRIDEFFIAHGKSNRENRREQRRRAMRPHMYTDPDGRPWEA